VDAAIQGTAMGLFFNQGEVCAAGTRVLVHRSLYDQVVDGLAGAAKAQMAAGNPGSRRVEQPPAGTPATMTVSQDSVPTSPRPLPTPPPTPGPMPTPPPGPVPTPSPGPVPTPPPTPDPGPGPAPDPGTPPDPGRPPIPDPLPDPVPTPPPAPHPSSSSAAPAHS
jgi:hypothetical protein